MKPKNTAVPILLLVCSVLLPASDIGDLLYQTALQINTIRNAGGLHELQGEPLAHLTAQAHAEELASRLVLSHRGLDGSRVAERYRLAGGTAVFAGENLGAGDHVRSIVDAWMESPSHRENILNPDWFQIGVGAALLDGGRILLVVVFTGSRWLNPATGFDNGYCSVSGDFSGFGLPPSAIPIARIGGKYFLPVVGSPRPTGMYRVEFRIPVREIQPGSGPIAVELGFRDGERFVVTDLIVTKDREDRQR